jgi:alpha-1,3-rhamnosyl/mannosyltransferase
VPRAVVTVYDLLLLSRRTDFPWYKRLYHRWGYQTLAKRAAHVLTISEFCLRDIVNRLKLPVERVSVVPPGLDPEFLENRSSWGCSLELPDRYILSVAGAYPHKRLPTLLDAFGLLCGQIPDLQLVIAGTYAGNRAALREFLTRSQASGLASKVRVMPRLRRADMPQLFASASALVSASEFEGFGIPILEAMAVGCPVAASPAEAVIEVLGGCGWVASDFTAAALAKAVLKALSAKDVASNVLRQATERARSKYTWDASAATVEAILGVSPDAETNETMAPGWRNTTT